MSDLLYGGTMYPFGCCIAWGDEIPEKLIISEQFVYFFLQYEAFNRIEIYKSQGFARRKEL